MVKTVNFNPKLFSACSYFIYIEKCVKLIFLNILETFKNWLVKIWKTIPRSIKDSEVRQL